MGTHTEQKDMIFLREGALTPPALCPLDWLSQGNATSLSTASSRTNKGSHYGWPPEQIWIGNVFIFDFHEIQEQLKCSAELDVLKKVLQFLQSIKPLQITPLSFGWTKRNVICSVLQGLWVDLMTLCFQILNGRTAREVCEREGVES